MKTYKLLVGILCMGSILVGCGNEKSAETVVETPAIAAQNVLEVDGEVCASGSEEIYIEFPAQIKKVHIVDGQILSKGMPLFTLDTSNYEDEIKLKESTIAVKEAEIKGLSNSANPLTAEISAAQDELALKEGYVNQQSDPEVKVLQSNMNDLQKQLETLQEEYKVSETLYENGALAEKELKDLKDKIRTQEKEIANLNTSIQSKQDQNAIAISALKAQITSKQMTLNEEDRNTSNKLEVAKLELKVAKEELAQLKKKYDKVAIKENQLVANKDELLVYDIGPVIGTQISSSTQLLAKCVELNNLIVTLEVPVEDVMTLHIGDEVICDVYTDQAEEIKGKISRISDRAIIIDGDSYVKVDAVLTQGREFLRLGTRLDATIKLS